MPKRRSRQAAWLTGSLLAAVLVTPALGQEREIGSRTEPRRVTTIQYDEATANQMARQYAGCLAHQRRDATRRFLDAQQAAEATQAKRVLNRDVGSCMVLGAGAQATGAAMQLPPGVLRGLLAEALLVDMAKHAAAEPLQKTYQTPWLAVSGREPVIEEMAACVTATHPVEVRALLATTISTAAEAHALAGLQPAFGPCLAANARVSATALGLRTAFAEELYHRETAPVTSSAVAP